MYAPRGASLAGPAPGPPPPPAQQHSFQPPMMPTFAPRSPTPSGRSFASESGTISPATGGPPASSEARRTNPLIDLIESEKTYVDEMGLIVKRVASAWSRSNFPPPDLDRMFRCIEAVYRANRGLLSKLLEIGPNPESPRALGDLLMRWIDDLDAPYTRYVQEQSTSPPFSTHPNILSNALLPGILASLPPSPSGATWSLDALFALPAERLRYYEKLYRRLLKSTKEGRSDWKMLKSAVDRLGALVEGCEPAGMREAERGSVVESVQSAGSEREVVGPAARDSGESSWRGSSEGSNTRSSASTSSFHHPTPPTSFASSAANSPHTSTPHKFDASNDPLAALGPQPPLQTKPVLPLSLHPASPVADGEGEGNADDAHQKAVDLVHRLDTSRTLDIFSMQPKKCKLQMQPPTLPFARSLRRSADVVLSFVPSSAPAGADEIVMRRAHVFLLTDLFLVAERMTPAERAAPTSAPGSDMWLSFPPLSGKFLKVERGRQDNALEVSVMKKEKLVIKVESREARDAWIAEFEDCTEFAYNNSLAPFKTALPPLSGPSSSTSGPLSPLSAHSTTFTSVPTISAPSPQASSPHASPPPPPARSPSGFSVHSSGSGTSSVYPAPPGVVSDSPAPSPVLPPHATFDGRNSPFPPPPPPPPGGGFDRSLPRPLPPPGAYPARGASAGPPGPPGPAPYPQRSFSNGPLPPAPGPGPGLPPHPHPRMGGPPGPPGGGYDSRGPSPVPPSPYDLPRGPSSIPPGQPYPPPHPKPPMMMNGRPGFASPPNLPRGYPPSRGPPSGPPSVSSRSSDGPNGGQTQFAMPSAMLEEVRAGAREAASGSAAASVRGGEDEEPSPPPSPTLRPTGPVTTTLVAQMRCKVFLQQGHQQWKSLGTGALKLYNQSPTNVKQLVVEADKGKGLIISNIILVDGVERIGKTGVAVELSNSGARTGIVYLLQLKAEKSAQGLFEELLRGSDRRGRA